MEVSKNSSSIVNEALELYEQAHWAVVAKRVRGRKKAINNVGGQGGGGHRQGLLRQDACLISSLPSCNLGILAFL